MPWRETEHRDFRGGENLADNAKTLRPNEIVLGENVVITGHAQAQKRPGMTQVFTSAQHPARIDHLSIFRRSSGEIYRMVVSNREIRLHDGTVLESGLSEGPYGQAVFADKWLLLDGTNYYESDGTADGTKPVALPDDPGATLDEVRRCNLLLVKGNRVWAAGDSQLPHAVYYSQPNRYDYFKGGDDDPDMTVRVGQHDGQPILVLTEIFGGILVGKPSGWWLIEGDPDEPSTFRVERLIAGQGPIRRAYAIAGSDVWYIADDGIRILREIESNVFTTILASHQHTPLLKAGDLSDAVMAYFDDRILISYKRQAGVSEGNDFCSLADLRFQAPLEGRYAAWTRITGWNISALAVDRGVLWGGTEDGKLVRLFDGSTDLGEPITLRLWTPEYPLTETFQQKIFAGVNLEIAQTGTTPVRPVHEVAIGLARQKNEWQEAFVAYEFDSNDDWNSGTHNGTKTKDNRLQPVPRRTVTKEEVSETDFQQGTLVDVEATRFGLVISEGKTEGIRVAPEPLSLAQVEIVRDSRVEWDAIEPTGTSVTIETSVDGGNTWQPVANGESIPGLHEGMAAESASVLWRQVLTSQDEVGNYSLETLPQPAITPSNVVSKIAFSPDGSLMALAIGGNERLFLYRVEGKTITKLPDPEQMPTGDGLGVAFSPDGRLLVVAHNSSPFLTIYKVEGETFTRLPDPAVLPTGDARDCAFSPDGSLLAVAHVNSPYVTVYKVVGENLIKIADPNPLPKLNCRSVAFNHDGSLLAVGEFGPGAVLNIYRVQGETLTRVTTLPTSVDTNIYGVAFSPDGNLLAYGYDVISGGGPYLRVYQVSGETFTPVSVSSPSNNVFRLSFSPDGRFLAVSHDGGQQISVYKVEGLTLTKLPDPSPGPGGGAGSGVVRCVAFHPKYNFITHGTYSTPRLWLYDLRGLSPTLREFRLSVTPQFPYTREWESPEIDLAAVGRYQDSVLQVEAEEFDGGEVAIYTRVSLDGGETWSQYVQQDNGEPIAGLTQGDDLSNARLQIKVVLTTNSEGNDPTVDLVAALFGFLGSVQRHFALRPRLRGLYIQHRITDSTPEQVTILAVGERWRPTRRLRPGEMEGSVAT